MKRIVIKIILLVLIPACNNSNSSNINSQAGIHQVIIEEVLQTDQYTYIRTIQDDVDQWLAVPGTQVETGSTYYYEGGLLISNFNSRELGRVFDRIIFLEHISKEPPSNQEKTNNPAIMHTASVYSEKSDISVKTADGGITIAELYSGKKTYAGKTVKIRGMVTKFNPAIMGKNWMHLQDGTEYNGHFDLTVTSELTVNTGEIVTFEGIIATDKDFGFGYFYDLIMEEGKILE